MKEIPASCYEIGGANNSSCVKTLGGGFSLPFGVAVDGSGNVFVADFANSAEIPASCIAGANSASCVKTLGGGLTHSTGVAVDGGGNVFVLDRAGNGAVKEIPAGCVTAGCVKTLGGGWLDPTGVAVDGSGNVFVADEAAAAVKEIPAGCVTASCVKTLGGGFRNPSGVAVDGGGNVFVADTGNAAVKEIPASCIAGANDVSCVETLGGGLLSEGVAVDGGGNVFVADTGHSAVKEILAPTLAVTETGLGSGQVTSAPAGIACGPTCSYTFTVGTPVTLTASAAAGSVFSGWTDATCSSFGTNPCTLTLAADTTVIASFARIPSYILTASLAGNGSGTVASVPSGINCGSMCSASFLSGTSVSLTATAGANSTFAGWGGACSGTGSCTVTMSGAKSVSASFTLNAVPLTSGNQCNGVFDGTFNGDVTVSAGQSCVFVAGSEVNGNTTINGGSFTTAGTVTGNVTENAGSLVLQPSAAVGGNVQVSGGSTFSLGPSVAIGGNLQIQQLSGGLPQSTVCGTSIKGGLTVQNNLSPIAVGANNPSTCAGNTVGNDLSAQNNSAALSIDDNTVGGNLTVQNNTPSTVDVSGNHVAKNLTCQGNTQVTHIALNMVSQNNQGGQCSAFP